MSFRAQMTLQSYNATAGEVIQRSLGNVNPNFIAQIGASSSDSGETWTPASVATRHLPYVAPASISPSPTPVPPATYNSFWDWADQVARGINLLSTNTFRDALLTFGASTTEELNA